MSREQREHGKSYKRVQQAWDSVADVHAKLESAESALGDKDAEIAKLRKELEEANEAVIAAHMLAFEKGKHAVKAELAEARKVIEALVADYNGLMLVVEYEGVSPTEIEDTYKHLEAARAFLAAEETKG